MFFRPNKDGTETVTAFFNTKEEAEAHERFAMTRYDIVSSVITPYEKRWRLTQIRRP